MFELLPYGATVNLKCTECSKSGKIITDVISETNYITEEKELGLDNCYFLESSLEPITMTYEYTKGNGVLIGVSTNLDLINCTTTSRGTGSFKISNSTIFNSPIVTEEIFIIKEVKEIKIKISDTPYSSSLKFYINNSEISSSQYTNKGDNIYYFKVSESIPVGSRITAKYRVQNDNYEEILTAQEYNSSQVRIYFTYQWQNGSPNQITKINIDTNDDVTNAYNNYNQSSKWISFNPNNGRVTAGSRVKVIYRCIFDVEEVLDSEEVKLYKGTLINNENKDINYCLDSNNNKIIYNKIGQNLYVDEEYYNQYITVVYKKETPFIKLLFNDVQVECCFVNVPGAGAGYENGWEILATEWSSGGSYLDPCSRTGQNYCQFYRYITVGWNKSYRNELFKKAYRYNGDKYVLAFATEGTNFSVNTILCKTDYKPNEFAYGNYQRGELITPPLDGSSSINDIPVSNFLKIGYTVNFAGESSWQNSSIPVINGTYYYSDREGFIYKKQFNNTILFSENSLPSLTTHPAGNTWGSNSKFYKTSDGKYVSPVNGLNITSSWSFDCYDCNTNTGCSSQGECGCDGDGGSDYISISEYHHVKSSPIRSGPGTEYPQIASTLYNDRIYFTLKTQDDQWYYDYYDNGWIWSGNFLD